MDRIDADDAPDSFTSLDAAMDLANELLDYLSCAFAENLAAHDAIFQTGKIYPALIERDPEYVVDLAYSKLNCFPFRDVPLCWRRLYEDASLWAVITYTRWTTSDWMREMEYGHWAWKPEKLTKWVIEVLRRMDMILIMTGAPIRRKNVLDVLRMLNKPQILSTTVKGDQLSRDRQEDVPSPKKRRRILKHPESPGYRESGFCYEENGEPFVFEQSTINIPLLVSPITRLRSPDIIAFTTHWHDKNAPAILTQCIHNWSALQCWPYPDYWLRKTHEGARIVPVELGKKYTDDSWTQKLMSFKSFIDNHLIPPRLMPYRDIETAAQSRDEPVGYLAQHDLLGQIPELQHDISIPELCYAENPHTARADVDYDIDDDTKEPMLNIWLGPADTVSPAHTDPHHNILAQVFGRKYVRLFAPEESNKLYPLGQDPAVQDYCAKDNIDPHSTDSQAEFSTAQASQRHLSPLRKENVQRGPPDSLGKADVKQQVESGVSREQWAQANSDRGRDTNESQKEKAGSSDNKIVDMSNTAGIDVGLDVAIDRTLADRDAREEQLRLQIEKFPGSASAKYVEGILHPGECLFIPRGWWHYVRSLDPSASVSFWWD